MKKTVFIFLSLLSVFCFAQKTDPLLTSGRAKQQAGKHQAAIVDLSGSIKKSEPEVQKYLKKLDAFSKMSAFEKADKGAQAPTIASSYAVPYYYRSISFIATGKNTEALKDLDLALQMSPSYGKAISLRGKIKWDGGNKCEGCTDLALALVLKDSSAKEMFDDKLCWTEAVKLYKDADSKQKAGQYDPAIELLVKALKICPDSVRFILLRGKCYYGLKKYDLALQDLNVVISKSSQTGEAFTWRGMVYNATEKYQEAFDDLSKAIQLNANDADAFLNRGFSNEMLSKQKPAMSDYDQVIKLKPSDGMGYFKRGLLKQVMGDKKGGCKDYKKAVELGCTDAADYAGRCK